MDLFISSGITGCVEPNSGNTSIIFNKEKLISFSKKDIIENFIDIYIVSCSFENYIQLFKFHSSVDRNNFYESLKIFKIT